VMKFKRGSSFMFAGALPINGAIIDMTGWGIECEIRQQTSNGTADGGVGFAIAELPAIWLDPVLAVCQIGDLSVVTYGWPVGPAVIDIKLTTPAGAVVISDSEEIMIVDRVTR